jgi:hypothetical protein
MRSGGIPAQEIAGKSFRVVTRPRENLGAPGKTLKGIYEVLNGIQSGTRLVLVGTHDGKAEAGTEEHAVPSASNVDSVIQSEGTIRVYTAHNQFELFPIEPGAEIKA